MVETGPTLATIEARFAPSSFIPSITMNVGITVLMKTLALPPIFAAVALPLTLSGTRSHFAARRTSGTS